MRQQKIGITLSKLFIFLSILTLIIGLEWSRAALSVSMLCLGLTTLLPDVDILQLRPKHLLSPPTNLWTRIKGLLTDPVHLTWAVWVIWVLITGLYSDNMDEFGLRMKAKVPLLILPLSIAGVRGFPKWAWWFSMLFYLLATAGSAAWSLYAFYTMPASAMEQYQAAGVMPTLINHIRFSLMVVMAIFTGAYLAYKPMFGPTKFMRSLYAIVTLFLIGYLHLLAVRSGLATFYLTTIVAVLVYAARKVKWYYSILVLIAMLLAPYVAYLTIPTLQTKVGYTIYDLEKLQQGDVAGDRSDTKRFISIAVGVNAALEAPLFGVGYGDIEGTINQVYEQMYPTVPLDNRELPHNQYIFTLLGSGIVGLFLLLAAMLMPVIRNKGFRNIFLLTITVVILTSFLVEYSLETQRGTAIYLLFFVMGILLNTSTDHVQNIGTDHSTE